MKFKLYAKLCMLFAILPFVGVNSQEPSIDHDELLDLSFEDLMNMEITSVSKKAERLQDVPSSIYVITQEDIQRSTAHNLMQLLRDNVPGFWAVTNDYANADAFIRSTNEGSVLILLNGTPMFDLLFSSFDYENFEIPFEEIDRIEVIKGSGGAVYGANSATGVISIYTKDAGKNNKFFVNADYSYPGRSSVDFIGSPVQSEKFNASLYGKYTMFGGFDQMDEVTNATSTVIKTFGSGDTTITNRYTENDNLYTTSALGLNLDYKVSDKLTLKSDIHLNYFKNDRYFHYFPIEKAYLKPTVGNPLTPKPFANDSVALNTYHKHRVVANLQAVYSFSEKHNVFARVSTNRENANQSYGGGFNSENNIIDFEVQDNFELPFNSISVGGNYRLVNYDLNSFKSEGKVYFTDPQNQENLLGLFVQDKISLIDGKLNFFLGLKVENFSLIDENFYFSPMAKFSFVPIDNFTLWGGYSKSYTTPGYNQTNIEYNFFKAESPKAFYDFAYPLVTAETYFTVYQQQVDAGATPNDAATAAGAYIQSPEGMYVIDSVTNLSIADNEAAFPGHFNVSAISSPNRKPTSFDNYEIGLRVKPFDKLSFETSFFYSIMKDGIGNSPLALAYLPSKSFPGEYMDVYYYGNYFKGNNIGLETVLKYSPVSDLVLELSHSWFKYTLEYQENEDFDITDPLVVDNEEDLVLEKYKQIPEHTLRAKVYYTLNKDWKFTLSSVYASPFWVRFGTIEPTYEYDNQRFDALYADGGNQSLVGGAHDNRFILNLRVDKYFLQNKLGVYLYGNDILSGAFTEGINQFETIYPRQVGSMFGVGVSYKIK